MITENVHASSRSAITEALMIVTVAAVMSVTYTYVTDKGLFASHLPSGKNAEPSITLTYEEARGHFIKGDALFVDARHSYDFGVGHIKGAVSVPLQEFDEHNPILEIIPKDRSLIVYCDGEECNSSTELAAKLKAVGYMDVKVFFGGWTEWVSHGQPRQP